MRIFRDKVSSGLGCILEWYDFALYGFFAPIITTLYFPHSTPVVGFSKTMGVFAVGFLARPFGALIFGYISDKYGRVTCLKLTPLLITFPTLAMALLPSYQQIGLFAPLSLTIIRILQGICVGGEFSNNIVYLCESSSISKRYFFGSIGACTGSSGILLASCFASLAFFFFSPTFLMSLGWRIGFGLAFPLGIFTYFMRRNMAETKVYKNLIHKDQILTNPIIDSYKNQLIDYVRAIGLTCFPATAFYFIFMFIPNYAHTFLSLNLAKILGDNALSLLARLSIIPLIGILADKIGGIKLTRISCLIFLLFGVPLFNYFIKQPEETFLILVIFGLLSTVNAAITPGLLISILKPNTRSTVFSFTFNFCFGFFGGIVPALCFLLIRLSANPITPIYYLLFTALITLLTTFFVSQEKKYE